MEFMKDLFLFLRTRKKFWMLPLIVLLLLMTLLVILTSVSAIAPMIYSVF